jgi:hypothetical protein
VASVVSSARSDRATKARLAPGVSCCAASLLGFNYLVLVAGFFLAASLGSPPGDARIVAAAMSLFVAAVTAWAAFTTLRMADSLGPQLRSLRERSVLLEALSFNLSDSIATRLRVFGGDRRRWVVPVIAAAATFFVVMATLSLLMQAMVCARRDRSRS